MAEAEAEGALGVGELEMGGEAARAGAQMQPPGGLEEPREAFDVAQPVGGLAQEGLLGLAQDGVGARGQGVGGPQGLGA